ncbi:MAG: YraN family protein [Oscillospiraceae bacterium]|nr:YraN family protein [Oscillospiraceae bacterium]
MEAAEKRTAGSYGEDVAAAFLTRKGYTVLQRNFSCRLGEIDIIASDAAYLLFVEVKLRKDAEHGLAREFVTGSKQKKIILTAKYYLSKHPTALQPRFDVVEVYTPGGLGGKTYVRLIEDAFS